MAGPGAAPGTRRTVILLGHDHRPASGQHQIGDRPVGVCEKRACVKAANNRVVAVKVEDSVGPVNGADDRVAVVHGEGGAGGLVNDQVGRAVVVGDDCLCRVFDELGFRRRIFPWIPIDIAFERRRFKTAVWIR